MNLPHHIRQNRLIFFSILFYRFAKAYYLKLRFYCNGIPVFRASELLSTLNPSTSNPFLILGSGPSAVEKNAITLLSTTTSCSFAVGRWYEHPFVPSVLFAEFSDSSSSWIKLFFDGVNSRYPEYSHTFLLIEIFSSNPVALASYLIDYVSTLSNSKSLLSKIRFVVSAKPVALPDSAYMCYRSPFVRALILKSSILIHIRSAVSLGLSFATLFSSPSITLVGVDGFTGYFVEEPSSDFHKVSPTKNLEFIYHSTSNPDFGRPTVTDVFVSFNRLKSVFVSSSKTLLAQYLPVCDCN